MADPAYGSSSNTTYASRTNTTVTAPASIANGDTLFFAIFAGVAGTAPTVTAPTGFLSLNGGTFPSTNGDSGFNANIYVWYKIASGESGNYTATHSAASTQGVMWRVSGGDGAQPQGSTYTAKPSNTTNTFNTLTTVNNGALVSVVGFDWGDTSNNLTAPTGTTPTFTERVDVAPLVYLATGNLATAGATGNKTMTCNSAAGGASPRWGIMTIVEPPVAGTGNANKLMMTGVGR